MFRRNMNLLAALWGVLAFVLGSVSEAGQPMIKPESVPTYQPKFYPFEGGEKAVYRTSWNGLVSVTTAEIYTTSTMLDGQKVYPVRVEAKTSRMLDLIGRWRDTIASPSGSRA